MGCGEADGPGLRVGLTGGIGSGKSSVAARLVERGATVVDADRIAREVVAPGTAGLEAVFARFGDGIRAADRSLDRAALARIVFSDKGALADLEAITHPLIWAETARRMAAAPPGQVRVHDMPLLVEKAMSADYQLVVVVLTDPETRVRRLVEHRGLDESDARARIGAQASDAQRRAAGDVLVSNDGSPEDLIAAVDALWDNRIVPYAANLRRGLPAPADAHLGDRPPEEVAAQGRRVTSRIRRALGERANPADPRASVVAGRLALELTVHHGPLDRERLGESGYPVLADADPSAAGSSGIVLGNCDPAWPSAVRLRPAPG